MKNNIIIDLEERLVRYLSQTFAGRICGKYICDEEDNRFPPRCVRFKDTGFQGFEPVHVWTYQPKKKPRHQELSAADKAENTMISRIRILVEHVIAGMKRCRIVPEVFRNTTAHFDDFVMEMACGSHNFRTTLHDNALE